MEHLIFEVGLALALIAAVALLAVKLRFSSVPLLILAGMAVGPHIPKMGMVDLRFLNSAPLLEFMGRLGVLFLLFYLGLEFSVGRLLKAGRAITLGGTIYLGINFTLGLLFGVLMGWPVQEVLVAAGITTISSSAIVAKVLVDLRRTANPETEMILGIILFEDIFLAVYLTVVSGVVLSEATSVGTIATSLAGAFAFIVVCLLVGRYAVPQLNRLLDLASDEVFLFVVLAGLLLVAGVSEALHVAEAIGALLAGLILAETAHRQRIEHAILPLRDVFGALFFFHFGLSIDPLALGGAVSMALGAVGLTLIGNVLAGMLAGRSIGLSVRASANIGLTIIARGEFSIVAANLGRAGGLLPLLQPFSALYVLILAILGPLLAKESQRLYTIVSTRFTRRGQKEGRVAPLVPDE
jgi:CPA2 family monovalent cation:H+ antiporter-2